MYTVAAHIIAKYSGGSFSDYVKERLFVPLNMTSTSLVPSEMEPMMSHAWSTGLRRIPLWFTDSNVDIIAGAGGIASTAEDMVCAYRKGDRSIADRTGRQNGLICCFMMA